jgi:hypothetical protein
MTDVFAMLLLDKLLIAQEDVHAQTQNTFNLDQLNHSHAENAIVATLKQESLNAL